MKILNIGEFKLGDEVEIIANDERFDDAIPPIGTIGTICDFQNEDWIGVEFDFEFKDGHDCDGVCEKGYGFYYTKNCIKHLNKILSVKQWVNQ